MKKNILIVIDAQNDFISMSLANPVAQERVPNIIKRIENFENGIIITTQDTHDANYMETPEGKALPVEHCIKNSEGWKIEKEIVYAIKKLKKEMM